MVMKIKKLFFALPALIICAASLMLCVSASDGSFGEVSGEYEQMLDGIPEDIAGLLPEGLFSDNTAEIYGAAEEMSSFSYIIKTVASLAGVRMGGALMLFAELLGLLIIAAVLRAVRGLIKSPPLERAVSFCSVAAVLAAVIAVQYEQLAMISQFLDRLNLLADSMLPLMGALYAMGGNVAAAAVNNSAMTLFLTICENLCNRTVIPVTAVCLSLALASAFSQTVDLKGISAFIKKAYTFVIGFVMMLLITVLSAQSTLAAAGDGVSARAAKFMAGNFIPVVGGAVGESLKTVAGSVKYIRTSVGVAGVIIIILLLLPALISVIMTRLSFMASGTAAKLLGCSEEAGLLAELTNIYGYLIAVICSCSVLFIFALTLLARTSAAFAG